MNRAQRRALMYPKGPKKKPAPVQQNDPDAVLDSCSPGQLADGINRLIDQMAAVGIVIGDWDDPDRRLYKIQQIKGQYRFLAAHEETEDD